MTDQAKKIAKAQFEADGWIAHDGGKSPVPADTQVDLRFYGYDSIRTPPYIRYHESWEEEAGSVHWDDAKNQHIGHHHADITHWRRCSWREGVDEHGQLRDDPNVAFRLVVNEEGKAPVARMMAGWNALGPDTYKKTIEHLPEHMSRVDDMIVSDIELEPIEISFNQALKEAVRLSGKFRQPDENGWHRMSNVARVLKLLKGDRSLIEMGASHARTYDAICNHPLIETRKDSNDTYLRPCNAAQPMIAVTTQIKCPGDKNDRLMRDHSEFGAAFRALLAVDTTLMADGTCAVFSRETEVHTATWSQDQKSWIREDGKILRRTHPTDPVKYTYRNGHMVDTMIGFVSVSQRGKIFATVGKPIDSEGDEDAFIAIQQTASCASKEEAMALLKEREDIDYIFDSVQDYDPMMGFWLTALKGDHIGNAE